MKQLIDRVPRIRVGIIAHGDYCDYSTYVLRSLDLTSDAESLSEFVKNVPQTSGGDCPEVCTMHVCSCISQVPACIC